MDRLVPGFRCAHCGLQIFTAVPHAFSRSTAERPVDQPTVIQRLPIDVE
jgi:hypothetical protein